MRCPRCHSQVRKGHRKCPNCGVSFQSTVLVDSDFVFKGEEVLPSEENKKNKMTLIVLIAVLLLCLAVAGFFMLKQRKPKTTKSNAGAVTTTMMDESEPPSTVAGFTQNQAAVSGASESASAAVTEPPTTVEPTTIEPTTLPLSAAEKLAAYARTSELVEELKSYGDNHVRLTVTAERNLLIAHYKVDVSAADDNQMEYFTVLNESFSKLSGNMDRMVYDMRQESGVTDAALQILVTDSRNVTIYQYLVD